MTVLTDPERVRELAAEAQDVAARRPARPRIPTTNQYEMCWRAWHLLTRALFVLAPPSEDRARTLHDAVDIVARTHGQQAP